MKKIGGFFKWILIVLCIGVLLNIQMGSVFSNKTSSMTNKEKLQGQRQLEVEGKALFRADKYEEALKKFQEANDSKYYLYEGHGNGYAESYIREIYVMRGEYEKALENVNKILALDYIKEMLKVENEVGVHHLMEQKLEYEALIRARSTKSNQPIYDYINYLKKNHAAELPPHGYDFGSVMPISIIIRLYDTIGDHDAGIAFIDECVAYFKRQDIKKYGEYKPGKNDLEYQKVRKAFEKDKVQGTKGSATQVLIQSDCFPW